MNLSTVVEMAKLVPFYLRWKLDFSSSGWQGPFQKSAGTLKMHSLNYSEHLIFISDRCQSYAIRVCHQLINFIRGHSYLLCFSQ